MRSPQTWCSKVCCACGRWVCKAQWRRNRIHGACRTPCNRLSPSSQFSFSSICPGLYLLQGDPAAHLLSCVMGRNTASHFLLLDRKDSEDIFSFCVKMAVGEIHTYEEQHEIQLQHARQIGGYVERQRCGVGAKRLKIRQ